MNVAPKKVIIIGETLEGQKEVRKTCIESITNNGKYHYRLGGDYASFVHFDPLFGRPVCQTL